ncbi:MAG: hypothetical protein R3C12_13635 [Planctomycetaceae bacterium]
MDTDDDKFLLVFTFKVCQVGQNVHAIDAAVGPEIEQHHLAAQVLPGEWLVNVQPAIVPIQAGGIEPLREGALSGVLLFGCRGRCFSFRFLGQETRYQ